MLVVPSTKSSHGLTPHPIPSHRPAVAKHAAENGKTYAVNLAAPFIPAAFAKPLADVLNYADIVFGNEGEAGAYAEANGMAGASCTDVALAIAALPKANGSKGRIVIITQGAEVTTWGQMCAMDVCVCFACCLPDVVCVHVWRSPRLL